METKKYYWLRLKNDFFTDKRIKKLRKIAGGDTYTIIYLKMQLLSLQDEGNLYFDNVENTFEEEIALQIDEDVEDVKITIGFLMANGLLVQMETNTYELIETKNCIGSETNKAESMRRLRAKRKEELINGNNVTDLLPDVTNCYIEKEIEKEKEKNKELDIYSYIEQNFSRTLSPIEYEVVSQWKDNELTRYAIKQAVLNGKYNLKYINAILQNWEKNRITSIQEAQQQESKFKNKVPKWINENINSDESTPDELEEFKKRLHEIDNT